MAASVMSGSLVVLVLVFLPSIILGEWETLDEEKRLVELEENPMRRNARHCECMGSEPCTCNNPIRYRVGSSCSGSFHQACLGPTHEQCSILIAKKGSGPAHQHCRVLVQCSKSPFNQWQPGVFCFAMTNAVNLPNFPNFSPASINLTLRKRSGGSSSTRRFNIVQSTKQSQPCSVYQTLVADTALTSFTLEVNHRNCDRQCKTVASNAAAKTCTRGSG